MPQHAFMYGLPYDYYTKHNIRRYGFHGTSHKYLVDQASRMLDIPADELNIITCHLGNGSSMTAVKNGTSYDTSMGLTPLEGLLMGTRSGDLDPAVPLHLQHTLNAAPKDMDTVLNKKSGLLGIAGSSDLRAVIEKADAGDDRAQLALDMWVYRVRKYLGAYTAALAGRVHAIVFSAGIGENSSRLRSLICRDLLALNISLDDHKNKSAVGGMRADVSAPDSKVKLLVIPTDEELSIAQQTVDVVSQKYSGPMAA
eukprot:GHRR01022049.1.p1 GENE.GHRR01022049.1~~GHRR01022049.1.p1  ORF type:complete len:255 (+),score=97.96 GHRR01022049.1:1041-1805(+)